MFCHTFDWGNENSEFGTRDSVIIGARLKHGTLFGTVLKIMGPDFANHCVIFGTVTSIRS